MADDVEDVSPGAGQEVQSGCPAFLMVDKQLRQPS